MNYAEAKIKKDELWADMSAKSQTLQTFPVGTFGLTPDDVKKSPEFIAANIAYKQAFERVRAFNGFFNKTFKAEYKADRLKGKQK